MLLLTIVLLASSAVEAVTHLRRNGGKIQPHPSSPLLVKNPYSFIEFYEQHELLEKYAATQDEIAKLSEKMKHRRSLDDPTLEERLMATDEDCKLAAHTQLKGETFLTSYALEAFKGYFQLAKTEGLAHAPWKMSGDETLLPTCSKYFDLPFSPYAYQHLEAMGDRSLLVMTYVSEEFEEVVFDFWWKLSKESNIPWSKYGKETRLALLGRLLTSQMLHKETSVREMVLVHTSAVTYWMLRGDAKEAMSCMRTALHYANTHNLRFDEKMNWLPYVHLQFGNLLTLSRRFDDAVAVLEAASQMKHDSTALRLVTLMALGDAHALSANFTPAIDLYKRSVAMYEQMGEQVFEEVSHLNVKETSKKRSSLICNYKIRDELEYQYSNLLLYIKEGEEYKTADQRAESLERDMKERSISESAAHENKLLFEQAVYGWNPYRECKLTTNKKKLRQVTCTVTDEEKYEASMAAMYKRSRNIEANKTTWKLVELFAPDKVYAKKLEQYRNMEMSEPQIHNKYPLSNQSMQGVSFDWRRVDWPSAGQCDSLLFVSDTTLQRFPYVFASPEEKGFVLSDLLTWFVGLEFSEEHPLPWEEPYCPNDDKVEKNKFAQLPGVQKVLKLRRNAKWEELPLKSTLTRLAERKMNDADVGQRIRTLMQYNIGPQWIAYNLAALYWRVTGHPAQATICLLDAIDIAVEFSDVALVQLAQLVVREGSHRGDARKLLSMAITVAPLQPQAHYLLGRLELMDNNVDSGISHLKDSLDRNPHDERVYHELLTALCNIGQPSKKTIRHLYPTVCCSPHVPNAVCFKEDNNERCFVVEENRGSYNFVYNRCNGVYTSMSYKPFPQTSLFSPFLPIFNTVPRKEKMFITDEPGGVQTILTAELPLDYGGPSAYLTARAPDWPLHTQPFLSYEVAEEEPDFLEVDAAPTQPLIPHKPLSLLWISDYSEMLKYDIPLPEVLPKPLLRQVKGGLGTFPPPRATPGMCNGVPKMEQLLSQVSTWLSVTAKGVNVEKHLSLHSPVLKGTSRMEPECSPSKSHSPLLTFDHLPFAALADQFLFYKPEKGLADALLQLGTEKETVETIGVRLAQALRMVNAMGQESELWLPAVTAALYWRVRGDGPRGVACLRVALDHAPHDMRDIPLVSLANVCHQAGLLHSALITAGAALAQSPNLVAIHFTIANIYASIGDYRRALEFYYSTISLQSTFEPAKERVRSIYCYHDGAKYNLHQMA